jgi:hypothetical protein
MTQDEIIEMAKQADKEFDGDREASEWVEYFAKLVAAKEREACALICAQRAKDFEDLLKKYGHEHDDGARVGASQCEQMIRARGEAV